MGLFSAIMDKIFHHPAARAQQSAPAMANAALAASAPTQAQAAPAPAQPARVDVGAVLAKMASEKGGGGNYQSSIVDLLKLLDLDSSLEARKQLAQELNVHAGADGSSQENIALHRAVMQKLAENGGIVPANLRGA